MKKSTHRVEIVELNLEKHPNADSLSIQKIFGYQVVLRTQDWEGVKYGAYLVPDSVVDTRKPEFSWLSPEVNKNFRHAVDDNPFLHRVTTMRLRGVLSYGLMVKAPEGFKPGDDASDFLGVTRYQPTIIAAGATVPPERFTKDYELEACERYASEIFEPGEYLLVTEKMDGVNARYCWQDDRLHAGSKSVWIDPEKGQGSSVWRAPKAYPQLETFCKENPELTVYGEIVGYPKEHKTKLRYGVKEGQIDFYIFDILDKDHYLNYDDVKAFATHYKLNIVPLIDRFQFTPELLKIAAGDSLILGSNHRREGVVIRSVIERQTLVGRAILKLVDW